MGKRVSQVVRNLALCAFLLGQVTCLQAGIRRHDVADSFYTDLAAQTEYDAVGQITINDFITGSATLIDDFWVLTAAHALTIPGTTSIYFTIDGNDYDAVEWIPHPSWNGNIGVNGYDIGLIRLDQTIPGITPAARYTGSAELGSVGTIVGYGLTGTGLTGEQEIGSVVKRAGHNMLDALGSVNGESDNYLMSDFDNPNSAADSSFGSSTPLPLEYSDAHGDSGGAVFIDDGGVQKVAGVISYGRSGPISSPDGTNNADYGDFSGYTRVSLFNDWIDDQISVRHWDNASGGSFSAGGNWVESSAPGSGNFSVFDIAGTYTVSMTTDVTNKRMRVHQGNVTLDLTGQEFTLANTTTDRSLVVGQRSGDVAALTLANGTVEASDASIGELSGSSGALTLTGTGSVLSLSGSLGVGGSPTALGGAGTLTVDAGASFQVAGAMTLWGNKTVTHNGSPSNVGSFHLTVGGLITGSGDLTANNGTSSWFGGTMSGSGTTTIDSDAAVNLTSSAVKSLNARTLVNEGTITWTGTGALQGLNSAAIENQTGAIFDSQSNASLTGGSSQTFQNAGTFKKSSGTGTTSVTWSFDNSGLVEVQTGTISFSGGYTHTSGTILVQNGATFASSSPIVIQSGSIEGGGTFAASVQNSGLASPGTSIGTLTINGDYTQTSSGELLVELASDSVFDQLLVNGATSLGGTLDVALEFAPEINDSFLILANDGMDSITDAFSNGSLVSAAYDGSLFEFAINYAAGTGNDVALVTQAISLLGDYNDDGKVSAADFTVWRESLGAATLLNRDPANTGAVGIDDFNAWKTYYGNSFEGSGTSAGTINPPINVPEPATATILALIAAVSVAMGWRLPKS